MTPSLLTALLGVGLVAVALLGPWLLRQAAPALVRVPRLAVVAVVGGIVIWLGTLLAVGPLLAWAGAGPALLPDDAAAVCQRCLAAANPYFPDAVDAAIPASLLLALPVGITGLLVAGVTTRLLRHRRRTREAVEMLLRGSRRRQLLDHEVSVVEADSPFALAFSVRQGGIVLSTGALQVLDEAELAAVLAHERAHVRQRHHLVSAVVESVAAPLRWVPLVAAAADALPHYLEIAADDQARRDAGTPALVSALLKLGERANHAHLQQASAGALHAAGPERIRHLVRPGTGMAGTGPAVATAMSLLTLAVISAAVHLPYLAAALSGCA